jgi:hypothetical protein
MNDAYKKQVSLLLDILPYVAEEKNFALHGGTAINLFHLDMPRLSVDVDLTWTSFGSDRNRDLQEIRISLENIKTRLKNRMPSIRFDDQRRATEELKLICSSPEATVKIEVNQMNRGVIAAPQTMILCNKAQEVFDRFCEMQLVSTGQLWGGKINAALYRKNFRSKLICSNRFCFIYKVKHDIKKTVDVLLKVSCSITVGFRKTLESPAASRVAFLRR